MGRPHRRGSETGIHHVMNRGVDRQPVFRTDADRLELGQRLAEIQSSHGVDTIAYCLMGNHFHLVLRADDGVLPEAMHHLTSVYSHRFNTRHRRDGPLLRGRYHSIPVESDAYLLWVTRYVHRNPLDIAGIESPRGYRWSSYRSYLGLRPCPAFLDRQPVMELFGGRTDELVTITEDRPPPPLRTVGDLTHLVRCARAIEEMDEPRTDRTLLLLLAKRTSDPDLARSIDLALGPHEDADPKRRGRRAEARLRNDPAVARALCWIERQLGSAGHGR